MQIKMHKPKFIQIIILYIAWLLLCPFSATALEMTPELLFRQMEEQTEQIFSLVADIRLSSLKGAVSARLSIQSPDKFEITVDNEAFRVVFDGENLWVFIASLNEVMVLNESGKGGIVTELLRHWVNPREIVTKVTRRTLFALFDIDLLEPPSEGGWRLRFSPRIDTFWRKFFDIGKYEMEFASDTYLPRKVVEYAPEGGERGKLEVVSYRINELLPKEWFSYEPASGVVVIPMSKVLTDKLSDSKEYLLDSLENWFKKLRKSLGDWGF